MNRYTNFILTVIAVAMIGILFKGEIVKPTHAAGQDRLFQYTWDQNEKIIEKLDYVIDMLKDHT